jgi:hypothetical protein
MNDPKKQHKTVLLPETEDARNVKFGWFWIGLLIFGVVMAFWRDAAFDPAVQQKTQAEKIKKAEEYLDHQKKMQEENVQNHMGKGDLKGEK